MALPVRVSAGSADCSPTSSDAPTSAGLTHTLAITSASPHTQPLRPAQIPPAASITSTSVSTPELLKPSVAPAGAPTSMSTINIEQASPLHSVDSSVPSKSTETAMCAPLIDSSPLSSPLSPLPAPPGPWMSGTASPTKKTGSVPSSITETKYPTMPPSPGSSKSNTSNTSKKRSRTDYDGDAPADKVAKQRKQTSASTRHAKVALTPQPQNTRPTRLRKPPQHFTPAAAPTPKKPAAPRKTAAIPRAWQPKTVTESAKSKLLDVDVYHMLLKDEAWTRLSLEQKRELFALIPDTNTNARLLREITAGDHSPATRPFELRINSSEFRCDVATYLEELSMGCMMKSWQEYAQRAVEKRAAGLYDDWKDEETEVWWGQNA